jgi:hypothetical protein
MKEIFGFNASSILETIQGVGEGAFGWDLTQLRDGTETDPFNAALVGATRFGATRGGFQFTATPVYEDVNLDGARPNTKNNKRLIHYDVKLSFSAAQLTPAKLLKYLDGAKSTVIANGLTEVTQDMALCGWPTYIPNVGFAITYGDCDQPLPAIFILKNALSDAGISISTADKQVNVADVEFTGHFDPATPTEAPWSIFIPTVL